MPPKKAAATTKPTTDKPAKVEKPVKTKRTATKALASAKVDSANIITKKRTHKTVDYSDTTRRKETGEKKKKPATKKSGEKKTKKSGEKKTESK